MHNTEIDKTCEHTDLVVSGHVTSISETESRKKYLALNHYISESRPPEKWWKNGFWTHEPNGTH